MRNQSEVIPLLKTLQMAPLPLGIKALHPP